jgi:hypothetical protein
MSVRVWSACHGAFGQSGFFAGVAAGADGADGAHVELEGAGEGGVVDMAGLGGRAAEGAEEQIGGSPGGRGKPRPMAGCWG